MSEVPQRSGPTPGYLYTLAAALVGLPCIGTGLGGALIARAGGDPIDALDNYAVVAFLFMFALAFAMRLIFWPAASGAMRQAVRLLLSANFALSIPLALLALTLSLSIPHSVRHSFVAVIFSVAALLCQVGSMLWLFRYRGEGL